jgi:hypothetical protein
MAPTVQDTVIQIWGGLRVDRATSVLPATTTMDLFTVAGGRVLIWQILGEVTTIIQTQANNTKLIAHPTVGTDVDLCAVLDTTALEVGAKLSTNGAFGTALVKGLGGAVPAQIQAMIISPGKIQLSCAATNTGAAKWALWYMALDAGASVAAA